MSGKDEINFPFAFVILVDIGINIAFFKLVRVSLLDAVLSVALLILFEIITTLCSALLVSLAARGLRSLFGRF